MTVERRRDIALDSLRVRTSFDGSVRVAVETRGLGGKPPDALEVELAGERTSLPLDDGRGTIELHLSDPARWWPHTHGEPALHTLRILTPDGPELASRRVGFRALEPVAGYDSTGTGSRCRSTACAVFARGAVWTPATRVARADRRASCARRSSRYARPG